MLEPQDRFCRYCGKGQGDSAAWYYKHWGIVVMLLCMGPFALFFVARSPVISRNAKFAYTAVAAVFTLYLLRAFYSVWNFYSSFLNAPSGLPY
jgi:hypothetical protein